MGAALFAAAFIAVGTAALSQEHYEINVSGRKIPFRFDPKRNVIVIEGEFLKQIPTFNLAELLGFAGNLQIVPRGLFQADPQMGGHHQEQIVIMVNGTPWNNAQTGHHNLVLPFEVGQIERIEILRGGSPALNSVTGAGGLVNIITSADSGVRAGFSSFGTSQASLNLGRENGFISLGTVSTNGYMEGLDGRKAFIQGGIRLDSLELWGGGVTSRFGARNFYGPYPAVESIDRILGSLSWKTPAFSNGLLDVRVSTQGTSDSFELDRSDPSLYTNNHETWQHAAAVSFRRFRDAYSYAVSVSADFDRIDSRGIRSGGDAEALGKHARQAYSLAGEFGLTRGMLTIQTGLRGVLGTYGHWSGHFLAGYDLSPHLRLSGYVSRSTRVPTYTELYYSDPLHRSNPGLRPETITSTSLSLEETGSITWGLRLFLGRSDDLIDWTRPGAADVWVSENIKRGLTFGADAYGLFRLSESSMVKVLYTYQDARFEHRLSAEDMKYRYYTPDHSLSLLAYQRCLRVLSLGAALKIEREQLSRKTRVYLNLRIGGKLGKAAPFLEVTNIFDNRAERVPGLPEPPRSFAAGVAYAF